MIDLICDFDKEPEKHRLYTVLKNLKGKNVIQIKKWRKKRSVNQNAFLWGVVYRYVSDETGSPRTRATKRCAGCFLATTSKHPMAQSNPSSDPPPTWTLWKWRRILRRSKTLCLNNFPV